MMCVMVSEIEYYFSVSNLSYFKKKSSNFTITLSYYIKLVVFIGFTNAQSTKLGEKRTR